MSSTAGAVALLIVLAVLIVGAFVVLWLRDKSRADEQVQDPERAAPDPSAEGSRDSFSNTPPGAAPDREVPRPPETTGPPA